MIAVVCNDAGGAEIVSSWAILNKIKIKLAVSGPAIKIFKKKFPSNKIYSPKKAIDLSSSLMTGSSYSRIELKAIIYAKQKNKKTILLDR